MSQAAMVCHPWHLEIAHTGPCTPQERVQNLTHLAMFVFFVVMSSNWAHSGQMLYFGYNT